MKYFIKFIFVLLLINCSGKSYEVGNYGQPEGLIDTSSELITISLDSPRALDEVVEWVNHEYPAKAELVCSNYQNNMDCKRALETLDLFAVPVDINPEVAFDGEMKLVLYYERIVVRDCDNHVISNHNNNFNNHMITWGCSNAVNMLQMVSDKEQFTNPELMDEVDAKRAVTNYRNYQKRNRK